MPSGELTEPEQLRLRVRRGEDPNVVPVSASKLALYDRCPRWAAYEYGVNVYGVRLIDKLPRVRGPAADLGDRFHRMMAMLDEGATIEEAADQLGVPIELWDRWIDLRKRAQELVNPAMRQHLAGVESTIRWRFPIRDGREVEVEARIDRLYLFDNLTAALDDYKTGTPWAFPKSKSELRKNLQLRTYALAVAMEYPETWEVDCLLIFPESGEERQVTIGFDDIEAAREQIVALSQAMAEDVDWKPKPGSCHLCPYAIAHCPVGKSLNGGYPPLVDEKSARALAQYELYLEGVLKQIKARLAQWTEAEGPIPVGDKHYGQHSTSATTVPIDLLPDAIRVMRQIGMAEEKMPVKWDTFSGYELLEGDTAIPELKEMAERTTRTWTGWRKIQQRRRPRGQNGGDYQ